jgi:hypothetical protein
MREHQELAEILRHGFGLERVAAAQQRQESVAVCLRAIPLRLAESGYDFASSLLDIEQRRSIATLTPLLSQMP